MEADTDADGLLDGEEVALGMNPTNAADLFMDYDGDGLNNLEETCFGSDPWYHDSDGDGVSDGVEYSRGTDPTDNSDGEQPPEETFLLCPAFFANGFPGSGGTVFKIGNYRWRPNAGVPPLARGRTYELSVYSREGFAQYPRLEAGITVNAQTPVVGALPDQWFCADTVIDRAANVFGDMGVVQPETPAGGASSNRTAEIYGPLARIQAPGGGALQTSWCRGSVVYLQGFVTRGMPGTWTWSVPAGNDDMMLGWTTSNAALRVNRDVTVTASYSAGTGFVSITNTINLLVHDNSVTLVLPPFIPVNDNDTDGNGTNDCEQVQPPANDPEIVVGFVMYNKTCACSHLTHPVATVTCEWGSFRIREWSLGWTTNQYPVRQEYGTSTVAFYVEGVNASSVTNDVRFLVKVEDRDNPGGVVTNMACTTILKVDFKELWETSNRVNQIFNPTLKDDPPPTASNKIYVVESPADDQYHVTLDVDDQPASMRSKLMYAVFFGGSKISGNEGFFPATGPADITFNHPSVFTTLEEDFELRVGYDLNGNSTLDSTEEIPISVTNNVGRIIGPLIVRGTSSPRYPVAMTVVNAAVLDTVTFPHASRLLRIFRDATTTELPANKAPTAVSTISFNCYSDPWAVWLTHNAGAPFNASGTATIQYYIWGTNTSLADLTCNSYQMKPQADAFYNATVLPIANAFFATNPVGTIATFPLDGTSYNIPLTDESPSWVTNYLPGVTVTFDHPYQVNGINDDINGTIGRGRIISYTAKFTFEKKIFLGVEYVGLTRTHVMGVVEDLYDFNRDGGGAGEEAAIIQLGHGNGSYGTGRTSGVIYRNKIEIDQDITF
jgi:hypothetical protein